MSHALDPLLRPRSIAVVGASNRHGSVGWRTMHNLLAGGYEGKLYAVNPGYDSVSGVDCYPDLASLPETVEHVILALGDARIEEALDRTLEHGARAATMMSSLALADDSEPFLRERIERRLEGTGLLVCGANGMGFYNCPHGVWVCGFDTRENHVRGGNVTLISHSGSGMAGIIDCEQRIDFNLAVSTGQELVVRMDQYMDYALEQPETRVIGLFMETARSPAGLIAAFQKALDRNIPVVVLKVGRTEMSARLAVSHSGAIAGRDDAYQAVFDRYGVQRVSDMHELATALAMFAQPHEVASGGVVALHDSGGERQLLIDLADDLDVPFTDLRPESVGRLEELLDPGLPAVNPLDAWGAGGPKADEIMEECMIALMSDPGAAFGAVIHDRGPMGHVYQEYIDYMHRGHDATGKPAFLVSNHQGSGTHDLAVETTRLGFPVLDGVRPFLVGARCLLNYRDFRARADDPPPTADPVMVKAWQDELSRCGTLDEFDSGRLLADFDVPVNRMVKAGDEAAVLDAASQLGFPLALKTAMPGIIHKTEHRGVRLGIENQEELLAAYRDMEERLGPRVLVSPMAEPGGQEMVLGMIRDEQFGPLVLLGFGGINVEAIHDVACALPPFGQATAQTLLDSLKLSPLLGELRNRPAVDATAVCRAASRFSAMVAALGEHLDEIDINPLIVHPGGCIALDALVVTGGRPG